jgi:hypothetical protein
MDNSDVFYFEQIKDAYNNYNEKRRPLLVFSRDGIAPNFKKTYMKLAKDSVLIIANKNYREWFPKGNIVTVESVTKFETDLRKLYKVVMNKSNLEVSDSDEE